MPGKRSKTRRASNTPRRKRTNKENRLRLAAKWLPTYTGKSIVRGYAKWFGVSRVCAALELQQLGIEISPQKIDELRRAEQQLGQTRAARRLHRTQENVTSWDDCDWFLYGPVPRQRPLVYQRHAPNRTMRRAMRHEELPF